MKEIHHLFVTTTHVSLTFEGSHFDGFIRGCHFDSSCEGERLEGEEVFHGTGSHKGDNLGKLSKRDHLEGSCEKTIFGILKR